MKFFTYPKIKGLPLVCLITLGYLLPSVQAAPTKHKVALKNNVIAVPVITAGTAGGAISACVGNASAGTAIQQFTVAGSNLTANITATAPAGFEVSLTSGSGYGPSVSITQVGGTITSTVVFVRSAAADLAGPISGNVMLTSTGATNVNVAVTGTVNALPTVNTVSNQTIGNGLASASVNFTGTGNTFTWVNDTPGIGLAATGSGNIASFNAVNNSNSPVTATITATPQTAGFAYITNSSGKVSVVNTITNTVVATVTVASTPIGVAVSADGSKVFVVNQASRVLSVINTATNTTGAPIPLNTGPIGVGISPDGSRVYVVNQTARTVSINNPATTTLIANVTVGTSPKGIAVSPDGSKEYVTNNGSNTVSVISNATNTVTATITVGTGPQGIAISPDGSRVYVTNNTAGTVSVINTATNAVVATITVKTSPYGVAVSPNGSRVYVANNGSKNVSVINTSTNTVAATVTVGTTPVGVSVSPDGSQVYVANTGTNSVSVISTATNTVTKTITGFTGPQSFGNFVGQGASCTGTPITFTITVNPTLPPTTPASNVLFSNTTTTSATASWTNGDGAARAVFMFAGTTGSPAPVDLTGYTANAAFGAGGQVGSSGWYCVYNGTGSTVNITGLNPATTYQLMAVEYNGTAGAPHYLNTPGSGNPASLVTLTPPAPVISGLSPSSGPAGTIVTLTGTDLSFPTTLTIGGQPAIVVSNTGTSLVAMVMPNSNGGVSLTTPGGTSTGGGSFTVTATPFPSVQQGAKLMDNDGLGQPNLGLSVAVSADGNTAIVGGYKDFFNQGAAWIYTRSGGVWTQQGSKLLGTGGDSNSQQGSSVAISADGNTVIVGGYGDNSNQGAAWVYTRSGGVWTQQGAKLVGTGNVAQAEQGISVSLSADGNTAIVGGWTDDSNQGAVWVYTRTAGVWTQQGPKLVGTGISFAAQQGYSLSLSADGNTFAEGGYADDGVRGSGWIFTRNGGVWSQLGPKLSPNDNNGASGMGVSTAISADGNTAIFGGTGDHSTIGAAWVFTRGSGGFTQQGSKLVGTGNVDISGQGTGVSLSADGNTAIVGGFEDNFQLGAAWVYTRSGSAWSQRGPKLVGNGTAPSSAFGNSVALSADGTTAFAGGPFDNGQQGAAWAFIPLAAPTTQAANINFTNTTATTTTASWTNGNGQSRTVFMFAGSTGTPAPVDFVAYNANATFGTGDQIGNSGWFCVYNGTGTTVDITGLTAGATYSLMTVEYSGTGSSVAYLTTPSTGNPANVITLTPPTTINAINTITSTLSNAASVQYTATFGASITGLTASNFSLTTTGAISGASIASVSGSGTTYTITVNTGTGDGNITLNLDNATSLTPGISTTLPFAGQTYTTDKTAPTVSVSSPSGGIIKGGPVSYTLTYADANFNSGTLATGDITLNTTGTATGTLAVSGTGTTRTVTITGITGDGTLGISIAANTATDLAGNAVPATGPSATFIVDNTPPAITISASSVGSITGTGQVSYTVTYADANFNTSTLTPANITLNKTSNANGTIGVTGSGTTYVVTISNISGGGTLGISIRAGTATDLAGNATPASGPSATFNVISSDATLSNITTSIGTLSPTFSPGVLNYTVNVINTQNAIRVTPTANDPNATIKVAGSVVPSGTQTPFDIPLSPGSNTVIVRGIAQDGVTKITYTLNVVRSTQASDAFLSNLALSSGIITPAFAPSVFNYTASVPNGTSSITVTPTEEDPTVTATITVNGNPVASGSPATVALSVGANTITTVVTAQNGINTFTYTTVVTRAATAVSTDATLSSITTSSGTLSPAFSPGVLNYTVNVINTMNAIKVTPTAHDPNATIKVAGAVVPSGTQTPFNIPLSFGDNTVIVKGIAQDGVTKITYTINVVRSTQASDSFLSNLALSDGTITPAFAPSVFNYTASVPNATASMTVTPTEEDPTGMATITVNGNPVASGSPATVLLNVGANTITTVVTAQNGINTFTYTTTVTRESSTGLNSRYQTISVNPSDSLRLANADVIVHPAVSPNGDGINDFLYIENIQNHPENKVTLINRSGAVLFEVSGYDNYSKVFNGHSSVTGNMVQAGTYYYLVEYSQNGENKRKTGFFVLK